MARPRKNAKRGIENYAHTDKERANNQPVGLVTPETDKEAGKKSYAYDPHLNPQIVWARKAEHTSFDIHERIDPRTIIDAVKKRNGDHLQLSLFEAPKENPPLRQAIEFYKHKHNPARIWWLPDPGDQRSGQRAESNQALIPRRVGACRKRAWRLCPLVLGRV